MPTTTPTKPARRTASASQPSSMDYIERLRKAATELRSRAEDEASDWEGALEHASEEMRRELGRLAVRAQRTPEALTEMSTEIRRRKTQLR
jgi:hypothetical protein